MDVGDVRKDLGTAMGAPQRRLCQEQCGNKGAPGTVSPAGFFQEWHSPVKVSPGEADFGETAPSFPGVRVTLCEFLKPAPLLQMNGFQTQLMFPLEFIPYQIIYNLWKYRSEETTGTIASERARGKKGKNHGGEGGIRTHGTRRYTRSPGERLRPDSATSPP